jgi:cytoskeletal protein CcmA (bactofilin family)
MMIFSKIKAGALQFVLFIGTIIVLLLFAFILINQSHSLFDKQTDIMVDLIQASDEALMESFSWTFQEGSGMDMEWKYSSGIQFNVAKDYWGLLEKRSSVSKKRKLQFGKSAFVGYRNPDLSALYIRDDNRPMVIVGDAKISGNAYLPERGIKTGNIRGYGYARPRLVYGNIYQSNAQLPELCSKVDQQLKMITSSAYRPKGNNVILKQGMLIKNSFKKETIVVHGSGYLDLDRVTLIGNVVVWAIDKIHVRATAQLRDVILVAPKIEIEQGTRGSFQAIASDRIEVGKGCDLEYPTILAVHERNSSDQVVNALREPIIHIESGSSISGAVIYSNKEKSKGVPRYIGIDREVMVMGEVYCDQALELKGNIYGSVTTGSFISFENGNTYLNHLFNGTINAELLPDEYCGLVYDCESTNGIAKWLY